MKTVWKYPANQTASFSRFDPIEFVFSNKFGQIQIQFEIRSTKFEIEMKSV